MTKDNTFGAVMIAGLIGAAVGLLFAPKSGKETRDELMSRADDAKVKGKAKAGKVRDAVRDNTEEVKGTLKRSAHELSEMGDEAKMRASRVKNDTQATSERVKADNKRRLDDNHPL
ncbi:MAG TPA: YtxH domain-containing protein [Candidatus Nitrosotenuis sp.]|nr:YtxH domain-containing protein [Candidatus Nitrosotenuis sp.]